MLFSSPLALLPRTLIAWALLTSAVRAGEALQLLPGVPVVVSEAEPLAVRKAAEDLCRDLQEVLQKASPLVTKAPADGPAIVIGRSGEGIGLTGPEAHAILREGDQVRLVGTDLRGTIYAIYSFSEQFLDRPRGGSGPGGSRGRCRASTSRTI